MFRCGQKNHLANISRNPQQWIKVKVLFQSQKNRIVVHNDKKVKFYAWNSNPASRAKVVLKAVYDFTNSKLHKLIEVGYGYGNGENEDESDHWQLVNEFRVLDKYVDVDKKYLKEIPEPVKKALEAQYCSKEKRRDVGEAILSEKKRC